MQGLIVENIANIYKVKCCQKGFSFLATKSEKKENSKNINSEIYEATARGKFKKDEITPVVGDFVEIETIDEKNKKVVINQILERKVYIKRPKLANITQIVFVISSKNPKPDLLLLDKQLAFAEYLGIKSIIVLNKTDLDDKLQFKTIQETYEKIGYKVLQTQAKNKKGVDKLKEQLKNNINAFSGNSGVGKSTLINGIFDDNITLEGEISKKNKKGKNTTTATKLYEIDENAYIADTPGFSTFSIEEIKSKDLDKYFVEFQKEIENCEFVGCTHIKEEKCGVKQAVLAGKIDKARYERFCKIREELKQMEEKRKW